MPWASAAAVYVEQMLRDTDEAPGIEEQLTRLLNEFTLNINDLPVEALHLIFGFLAPRELCRISAVCKAWRDLNKDASANRVRVYQHAYGP